MTVRRIGASLCELVCLNVNPLLHVFYGLVPVSKLTVNMSRAEEGGEAHVSCDPDRKVQFICGEPLGIEPGSGQRHVVYYFILCRT